jgi:hypothetical protein
MFYGLQDSFFMCLDMGGLTEEFGFEHTTEEWWLFTDLSKVN